MSVIGQKKVFLLVNHHGRRIGPRHVLRATDYKEDNFNIYQVVRGFLVTWRIDGNLASQELGTAY